MEDAANSRTMIKTLALDLLVRHGYRGMNFADIAETAGITRANVHYHFGGKAKLIDEVLADYVAETLGQLEQIWASADTSFAQKLATMQGYSRSRYLAFNRASGKPRPWSLISRLRQDEDMLTEAGKGQLKRFTSDLQRLFAKAAERAHRGKEFRAGVTPAAAATLLVAIADNAAPITMAGHGFASLEEAYAALICLTIASPR